VFGDIEAAQAHGGRAVAAGGGDALATMIGMATTGLRPRPIDVVLHRGCDAAAVERLHKLAAARPGVVRVG
jgi:hypothetical protein